MRRGGGWWLVVPIAMGCGWEPVPGDEGTGTGSSSSGESSSSGADVTGPAEGEGSMGSTGPVVDGTGDSSTGGEPLLGPPYPIVLAHGFFGFENLAGLDFVPYWYGVPEHLEALGHTVCVGEVDPFNDSTDRGMQLLERAQDCAAATGHAKVNILAHSQGGLDARVAAHMAPQLVASVTTVATPHHGTPIADIALGLTPNAGAAALVDWLVQNLGAPIWDEVGNETSLYEALYQMSQPGITEFNATYTDAPGVLYTSVTGRTGLHDGGDACEPTSPPPPLLITHFEDTLDTTDALFLIPEVILSDGVFSQQPNDALVRVVDSRWGEFLGCVPADHLDEVGQLIGDSPGLGNAWNHLDFYADLVAYLRDRGL
ncbi:esterase/lipase family protein [Paraliomyxa miuraensis]|uniref:esterase/lipase family protein n=1 Tax=Paraliomyxa miuraensis TaxID=376150 RepID=UPI00225B77A8|nr:alpha/beta fold hydrolase [Paraliomyxa miuraensis]MCX4246960.1 alpha/beta fold hydrolase [Paraliomyxa miuraensis]